MSNGKKNRGLGELSKIIFGAITGNLSVVASVSALAIGGLTLLMYALSIGQLPDFTWNELTGTLLAVCATGVLVVTVVVMYCLSAGYFARAALESVYPEAASHTSTSLPDPDAPVEPYVRLIRGPFIFGVTCISVLAWIALFICAMDGTLISPHNEHLVSALIIAFATAVTLLFVDWRRFRRQWLRKLLLSIFTGAVVALVVIMTAWSIGPNNLSTKATVRYLGQPISIDWAAYSVALLNNVILVGVLVVAATTILLNIQVIATHIRRAARWCTKFIPWKMPSWLRVTLARTSHVALGNASDRRLVKAKIYVTIVFCCFTIGVFLTAYAMASIGSKNDWNVNFFFVVSLLTVLNWVSFSVRHWRERAGLGLVTAALVFLTYPIVVNNPVLFPRAIVSMLGLGNERLDVVALSSKQCATLANYGVNCVADNDRAITLENVNMLNRLGNSIVLELLIKDERAGKKTATVASSVNDLAPPSSSFGQVSKMPTTLVANSLMGSSSPSAKFCDKSLLSNISSTDAIKVDALRCVELVVPKDQVLGYSKVSWRNYRGEYTAYRPGPIKPPAAVNVTTSSAAEKRGVAAAVSAATTSQTYN